MKFKFEFHFCRQAEDLDDECTNSKHAEYEQERLQVYLLCNNVSESTIITKCSLLRPLTCHSMKLLYSLRWLSVRPCCVVYLLEMALAASVTTPTPPA